MFISCPPKSFTVKVCVQKQKPDKDIQDPKASCQSWQDHCSASESKQWHRTTLKDRAQRAKRTTAFQVISSTSSKLYTDDFQLILRENNSLFPKTDKIRTITNVEYLQFSSQELVQGVHPWDDKKLKIREAAVNLTESGELRPKGPLEIVSSPPQSRAKYRKFSYPSTHLDSFLSQDLQKSWHFFHPSFFITSFLVVKEFQWEKVRSRDKGKRKGRGVVTRISLDQVHFLSKSSSKRCAVRWDKNNVCQ